MSFSIIFSLIITFIFLYFNFDIIKSINFTLMALFYISILNFLKCFMSYFSFESIEKTKILLNNKELTSKIKECINKNKKLIKNNNDIRKDLVLQNLKNAHLTLVIASLTKNNEIFTKTINELATIGIDSKVLKKYENLLNLINLIEAKKVEIVILCEDKKLIFKDISEDISKKE